MIDDVNIVFQLGIVQRWTCAHTNCGINVDSIDCTVKIQMKDVHERLETGHMREVYLARKSKENEEECIWFAYLRKIHIHHDQPG